MLDLDAIICVAVHPQYRNNGIGVRVASLCVAEARRRGKVVLLTTDVPTFYEKIGFQVCRAYDAAEESFLMTMIDV